MTASRALKIVEGTAWAVLVVSMAVLLLVSLVGEKSRVTLLILYAPRFPLLIPFAVATACAARPGRRKLLPVAAAAGLVLAVPVLGFELPGRSQQASGTALRLLTYNVYYGRLGADRVLAEIEAAHADVVVLQATSSRTDVLFKQRLSGAGAVSVERDFFLHTRLPLRDVHVPPLLEADLPPQFVRYTIDTAKGPIDVYNVHPYSPRNALRWGAHPLDTQHREQQVTAIMTDARSRTNPVVIAGDTNLPPLSAIGRRHLTGFRDAFEAVGGGLGYTFPTKVPWMRIDRVLCGPGVRPLSVHVGARGASDHMSLLAELEIVGRLAKRTTGVSFRGTRARRPRRPRRRSTPCPRRARRW